MTTYAYSLHVVIAFLTLVMGKFWIIIIAHKIETKSFISFLYPRGTLAVRVTGFIVEFTRD